MSLNTSRKKYAVSNLLRTFGTEEKKPEFNFGEMKRTLINGAVEKVKLKQFRKRMWWKFRVFADSQGFPQEIGIEEYQERRRKDETKFVEEFPSIIWQEKRKEKTKKEKDEVQKRTRRQIEKERLDCESRRLEEFQRLEKMSALNRKYEAELAENDTAFAEALKRDKRGVQNFEKEEREKTQRLLQRQLEERIREERAKKRQLEYELAREEEEKDRLEKEITKEDAELTRYVTKLMVSSGIKNGEAREKAPELSLGSAVVRFVSADDEKDAVLKAFNLWPLTQYLSQPVQTRKNDQEKKFPHLFSASVETLSGTKLGKDGCRALGKVLQHGGFPRLKELSLRYNDIQYKGCSSLMKALCFSGKHSRLENLFLSGNNLGDNGIKALSTALIEMPDRNCFRIKVIDLSSNSIADEGAKSLSKVMFSRNGNSIKVLKVGHNKIGKFGAQSLVRAGRVHSSIELLVLANNMVPHDVANALAMHATFLQI